MEAELRQELARLQEREAELTHLLQLERERRVRAEQDSEIEKQACLELGQLLSREKQLRQTCPTSPSQMTLVPSCLKEEEEEEEVEGGAKLYPAFSPHTNTDSKITNDGGIPTSMGSRVMPEENERTSELPSLGFNFSSSIFSQLPNDLQEMLGICKESISAPPPSKHTLTKAMEAVKVNDSRELEQCVVSLGKELLEGADGQKLLELACEQGHTGCVRVLLHGGCSPSVNSREDGMAPTHLAARNGHLDSLQLLLEWGVSGSQQDNEGHTPLFLALCEGHKGCADRLLHAGSSLQAVTKSGYTIIHAAVSGNLPDTLRMLLVHLRTSLERSEVIRVVNYTDKDGSTALHFAASRGYKSCVEVLCASPEVDIGLRDRWNRTALDISTEDCRELLQTNDYKQVVVTIERKHAHGSDQLSSVPVGRIAVLKHHKLSDIEPLIDEALKQYSNSLSEHRRVIASDSSSASSTLDPQNRTNKTSGNSLSELVQKELHKDSDSHLSVLKNSLHMLSRMDLSGRSIASYRIGNLSWKAGGLLPSMKSKNLFGMFGEAKGTISRIGRSSKTMEVTVTLKGAAEGCVDQLAFDLMLPVAKLREYVEMVIEDNQTIMLYGHQGSGKTFLAKSLAEFIKCKHDSERVQIIHVSLHPGFKRDDLFRLLHLNSLLVPQDDQERDMKKESKTSRTSMLQPKSHVVVLDDMDQVSTPSVLAELLTALEYRGPYYPVWVDAVYSRQDGTLLYPAGHYYLKEKCYFIATRAHASGEGLQSAVMEQFVHVSLGLTGEPCSGILHRHLMSRLIHSMHGDKPHRSDLLNKVVQWVWEVWQLYNHLMLRLNLPELTTGLRHFLHCPVESSDPETVCSWLCSVWNHHLLPSIKTFLLSPRPYGGININTHTVDNHHDNDHYGDNHGSHHDTISQFVTLITQKVFKPTCPLDPERTIGLLKDLRGSLEITARSEEKRKCEDEDSPPLYTVNSCAVSSPPPRETKLPSNSMVAYEDMTAKSSPRMRGNPPRSAPLRAVHPSDVAPSEVTLRPNINKKRDRRLKSFSLFSKDGMASLPRLLRRNSTRTSVAEERPKKTEKKNQRAFSHDMEDVFNLLSSTSSDRIDDQRSPIPLVPKYKVSTGSMQNKHLYSNGLTPDSPPAYSMPDLTADEYPIPSEDMSTQFELDMHPKSYSIVNLLDEESSSEGRGGAVPVAPVVRHLKQLPLQPSSEPTKRRIHTSPLRNGVTQSSQSTPGASRKASSPLTSPLTTAHTRTSPCAKSPRNASPASAAYQYVNSRSKDMKAKSACDLLSDDMTDLDLFRAASEGEIKPQTSDYVSDDGRTLQSDPNTSNLSTLSDLDFDISSHFERRMSDACTSSTLFFSASLGFSPDSAIMKGTPPRDCSRDRLTNPRPSILTRAGLAGNWGEPERAPH